MDTFGGLKLETNASQEQDQVDRRAESGNKARLQRSMSLGEDTRLDTRDRMKHTRDWKTKGFKGNSRGDSIQQPFTTLEELFKQLPESVGFNIEVKYPMLFESEQEGMDNYAVE